MGIATLESHFVQFVGVVNSFCAGATKCLNVPRLKTVSFKHTPTAVPQAPAAAQLSLLGAQLEIHFAALEQDGRLLGRAQTVIPANDEQDKVVLDTFYFDHLGNTREDAIYDRSKFNPYGFDDDELYERYIERVAERYSAHISATP